MIADVLNAIIGIATVYVAVLRNALLQGSSWWIGLPIAAVFVIIALFARRSDYHPWHSNVVIVLAAALAAMEILSYLLPVPLVVKSWTFFWVGLLVAFFSLWAALYRPAPAS